MRLTAQASKLASDGTKGHEALLGPGHAFAGWRYLAWLWKLTLVLAEALAGVLSDGSQAFGKAPHKKAVSQWVRGGCQGF